MPRKEAPADILDSYDFDFDFVYFDDFCDCDLCEGLAEEVEVVCAEEEEPEEFVNRPRRA